MLSVIRAAELKHTLCLTNFCHSVFHQHPTGNRQGKGAQLNFGQEFISFFVLSFVTANQDMFVNSKLVAGNYVGSLGRIIVV
jgi:hypothetical protein